MAILNAGHGHFAERFWGARRPHLCSAEKAPPAACVHFLLGVTFALVLSLPLMGQTRSAGEYEVKAAFIFNFAKFVEWPRGAFNGPNDPIRLCLWGESPFDQVLEQVVQGKTVNGRPFHIERLHEPDKAKGCQILFINAQEKPATKLLRGEYGPGILTIGESDYFAQAGGIINFVLQQNRVSFEINVDAADRAGIKISSKLLSLSRIVRDSPSAGKE